MEKFTHQNFEMVVLNKSKRTLYSVIFLFAILILSSCVSRIKSPQVVLIGIDGADWRHIYPFLEEGLLPNFRYLLKNGSHGYLKTYPPGMSPVVWTSIATGKSMVKHGVIDWVYLNESGAKVPYTGNELKATRVWRILNFSNKKVGVINWLCSYPPEKVNGYVVSEGFKHGVAISPLEGKITYPYTLLKKIEPRLKRGEEAYFQIVKEEGLPDVYKTKLSDERKGELKTWILQDKSIEDVSLYLLTIAPVDFFATYFRIVDVIGHYSSGMVKKEVAESWAQECLSKGIVSEKLQSDFEKEIRNIFKPYYIYIDRVIGKFLKKVSNNTTIIVVSDHGFRISCKGFGHYPDPPDGIIVIKGPEVKKNHEIKNATIYDITPTILHIFGMPVAKDMDGKVILEAFKDKYRKGKKVDYVESYENFSQEIKRKREGIDRLDEETLEQLRALGYIK